VTGLLTNPPAGYPWDMMASSKLEARIAEIIAKRGIQPATDAEMEAKELEIRREQAERKAQILLGRLDARYRDAIPRTAESVGWLKRYLAAESPQDRGRGLILLGPTRSGKTWEAASIARILLVKYRVPVQFVEAPEMMAALRPNAEGASDIGQFMAAPVLIIDDLGAERTTEWTAEQLFRLAHYRDVHCLPTIFTTNLEGAQLRERYSDRVINRLAEGATLIRFTTPVKPFRETPL
jgi:DNA replication protein DnaC